MHTNRKTVLLVPQYKVPRPARPVERKDTYQQRAPFQKKSCFVSSVIHQNCTTHLLVSRNKNRIKRKNKEKIRVKRKTLLNPQNPKREEPLLKKNGKEISQSCEEIAPHP